MYVPAHFRLKDREDALALMNEYPFATVVSVVDGTPMISYLPTAIVETDTELRIAAHFARANPHWKHVEAAGAMLLFHGPHGYVSAGWYTEPSRDVPTWNYAVVHAAATARLLDEAGTSEIVALLTEKFEGTGPEAWSVERAEDDFIATQLRGIVGVHFTISGLDAKFKLSQNRASDDRNGALAGLRKTGRESDRQLADLMEQMSRST